MSVNKIYFILIINTLLMHIYHTQILLFNNRYWNYFFLKMKRRIKLKKKIACKFQCNFLWNLILNGIINLEESNSEEIDHSRNVRMKAITDSGVKRNYGRWRDGPKDLWPIVEILRWTWPIKDTNVETGIVFTQFFFILHHRLFLFFFSFLDEISLGRN